MTPMLREAQPIGAIGISRRNVDGGPRPFSDKERALLQTFADQAVIAIETCGLFNDSKPRTHRLERSVEELRGAWRSRPALSSTLDLDTVLQTIVIAPAS